MKDKAVVTVVKERSVTTNKQKELPHVSTEITKTSSTKRSLVDVVDRVLEREGSRGDSMFEVVLDAAEAAGNGEIPVDGSSGASASSSRGARGGGRDAVGPSISEQSDGYSIPDIPIITVNGDDDDGDDEISSRIEVELPPGDLSVDDIDSIPILDSGSDTGSSMQSSFHTGDIIDDEEGFAWEGMLFGEEVGDKAKAGDTEGDASTTKSAGGSTTKSAPEDMVIMAPSVQPVQPEEQPDVVETEAAPQIQPAVVDTEAAPQIQPAVVPEIQCEPEKPAQEAATNGVEIVDDGASTVISATADGADDGMRKKEIGRLATELVKTSTSTITLKNLKSELKTKYDVQLKMKARRMVESIPELKLVPNGDDVEVRLASDNTPVPDNSAAETDAVEAAQNLTPSEVKQMAVELVKNAEKTITVADFRADFKEYFGKIVPSRIRLRKLLNTSKELVIVDIENQGSPTVSEVRLVEPGAADTPAENPSGVETPELSMKDIVEKVVSLIETSTEPVTTRTLKKLMKDKYDIDLKMKVKKLITSNPKQLQIVNEDEIRLASNGSATEGAAATTEEEAVVELEDLPQHFLTKKVRNSVIARMTTDGCVNEENGAEDLEERITNRLERIKWKRPKGISRKDFSSAVLKALLSDERTKGDTASKVWVDPSVVVAE